MNKDKFWHEYDSVNDNDLLKWFTNLTETDKNKIRNRVKQLNLEIIHEEYYDGWTLDGLIKEKEKLSKLI